MTVGLPEVFFCKTGDNVQRSKIMLTLLTVRRIAALFAFAITPALAQQTALQPAPLDIFTAKECGETKNVSLAAMATQPLVLCPDQGTRLTSGTTNTARLAGRRLYLTLDLEPVTQPSVWIELTMSTFTATGQVRTHLGMPFMAAKGRLETSIYVPEDAASVYWTLSGAWGKTREAPPRIVIRHAQTQVSTASYTTGQMCASCARYLDETVENVRQHFLYADRLPLAKLEGDLRLAATGAQQVRELDGVLKELSRNLTMTEIAAGTLPHGRFMTQTEFQSTTAAPAANAGTSQTRPQSTEAAAWFDALMRDGRVGYVRLQSYVQATPAQGRAYTAALRLAIMNLHQQGAERWVLDLRQHQGGTLFPAVAALRPLLGKGAVGYFVDAGGKRRASWLWGLPSLPEQDADPYFSKSDPDFNGDSQPVALLIGSATASTGEMLAIAFHGRSDTRSFGTPTMGATTSVFGAPDQYGNFFGITALYSADRNGQRIHPKVVPDVVIDAKPTPDDRADPVLAAALTWLTGHRQSRGAKSLVQIPGQNFLQRAIIGNQGQAGVEIGDFAFGTGKVPGKRVEELHRDQRFIQRHDLFSDFRRQCLQRFGHHRAFFQDQFHPAH